MDNHGLDYLVNCSMLFTERPLLEQPRGARAAGFDAIEFWWPWPEQPAPADAEVDAFIRAIRDAGVRLIGLNFFAGDLAGPDAGVLSIPDRSAQFRDNLDVAAGYGIGAVIQPGGSRRDAEVIAAADEHGMAMVFTGMRHFRH